MIPKKLILCNFAGIKSGLGRDEIVLDLEYLVGDAQLVALKGDNGAGKSTILDNLHPYRLMPSRASSYSPAAFSYYDNVYGAEAQKDLEWEHDGTRYRSILIFRMGGKSKKTECYLQRESALDGGWQAVRLPDGTTSDGKTETYDRCVEHILGSPEMFFTSVFAAQGRKSLSSYTNGEIKGLLSELLGLERIRELGKGAGEVAKRLRDRLDGMRGDLQRLDQMQAEHARAEQGLDTDKASLMFADQARRASREMLAKAQRKLAAVQADTGASAEIEEQRTALTARIVGIERRQADTRTEISDDIKAEVDRSAIAVHRLRSEVTRIRGYISAHDQTIQQNQAILARKAEITSAQMSLAGLEQDEALVASQVDVAQAKVDQRNSLVIERNQVAERLRAAGNEGKTLAGARDALKARAILIEQVPCQGTDLQPQCKLLSEAMQARAGIPRAEQDAETKRAEYQELQVRGQALNSTLDLMSDVDADLTAAKAAGVVLATHIRSLTQVAALAPSLAQAEQAIEHARTQKAELEQALAEKEAEVKRTEEAGAARVAELQSRLDQAVAQIGADLSEARNELAALPPPADLSALAQAEQAVRETEETVTRADQEAEQINVRIATHKERLRMLGEQLREAPAIRARAATIETEIAHWTTLAKALGNDGIIALSIDDAGPTLASLANDLLLSCYGPRFSVRMQTQEQTQKGDARETFDIIVFDAARDDEKSVRTMSGGEKIWINECLTRAIALYQGQMSGQHYGAMFADESDGALDPARKQMFMKMKREALKLSGCRQEFFISHTPELWEMADATIDLAQFRQ